jgi:hypothetical protein
MKIEKHIVNEYIFNDIVGGFPVNKLIKKNGGIEEQMGGYNYDRLKDIVLPVGLLFLPQINKNIIKQNTEHIDVINDGLFDKLLENISINKPKIKTNKNKPIKAMKYRTKKIR